MEHIQRQVQMKKMLAQLLSKTGNTDIFIMEYQQKRQEGCRNEFIN